MIMMISTLAMHFVVTPLTIVDSTILVVESSPSMTHAVHLFSLISRTILVSLNDRLLFVLMLEDFDCLIELVGCFCGEFLREVFLVGGHLFGRVELIVVEVVVFVWVGFASLGLATVTNNY